MASWRFRMCPECRVVLAASKFTVRGTYRAGWDQTGHIERQCPECGNVDSTYKFKIVREKRAS